MNYWNNHKAFVYIQCTDASGEKGSFLGDEEKNSISPVFDDLVQLFLWLNHSNFEPLPGQSYKVEYKPKD